MVAVKAASDRTGLPTQENLLEEELVIEETPSFKCHVLWRSSSQKDGNDEESTLDLICQSMKKLTRYLGREKAGSITQMHLDNNNLHKLEFLSPFKNLTEFTAAGNQLLRMYNIASLRNLVKLDLSFNKIMNIEGLKEVIHLTYLNLAHNKIKKIDQLHNNINLEHLDLSDNLIINLSNLSQLSKLKNLLLHKNQFSRLRHAEVFLPKSIETLTLAENKISDLNEISRLVGLINLKEISFKSNPCIEMTGQSLGFDYRPFLVNWCPHLKIIDDFVVDEIERLRGEWLYSHGKGRKFQPGEHSKLVKYLAENVPFNSEPLRSEQERKLKLILTKAHQHQSRLFDTLYPGRIPTSRISKSLDSSRSYGFFGDMAFPQRAKFSVSHHYFPSSDKKGKDKKDVPALLPTVSKLVPVPESLISPAEAYVPHIPAEAEPQPSASSESIYYNCAEISASDLKKIKTKADEIDFKKSGSALDLAAKCIQRNWKSYLSRKPLSNDLDGPISQIQKERMQEHIEKLTEEMSSLKQALENEHKLHVLQMQAINTLWRKLCNWQQISRQRNQLHDQVDQVHACIEEMQRNLAAHSFKPAIKHEVAAQTVISAVHTSNDSFLTSSLPSSSNQVTASEEFLGDTIMVTDEDQDQHSTEAGQ